jgi:hypothetical protein
MAPDATWGSARPTPQVSVEPPAPTPTSAAAGELARFRSAKAGCSVGCPKRWFTIADDHDWNGMLFDRSPLVITADTGLPSMAVHIREGARPFATVVDDDTTSSVSTVRNSNRELVGGLQGLGIIDRGARSCLIIELSPRQASGTTRAPRSRIR